jgi:hypothetical protein
MTEVDRVKIIVEEVTGAGEERDLKQRWQVTSAEWHKSGMEARPGVILDWSLVMVLRECGERPTLRRTSQMGTDSGKQ